MDSSRGLSPLQADLLREFFARERRFVLTGGGALVGYHLHHRSSDDIDLFTKPPVTLEDGRLALDAAAAALGATSQSLRSSPEFQRTLVQRGEESAVVDLVVDRAPDVDAAVDGPDGIRMHSVREIADNKVCALIGRGEIRDFVDLRMILLHGLELADVLADAERKDGGVAAATLAWILDGLRIGSEAEVPGVTAVELETFRRELVVKLRALAMPLDT